MTQACDRAGWLAGLIVGVSAAVIVVAAGGAVSAPPAAAQQARLTVTASPTGELAVSPTEVELPVVSTALAGSFAVFNQTGSSLSVILKAVIDHGELAGRLDAHVAANDVTVFDGPVGGLADGSVPFVMRSGETTNLVVTFTVPDANCPYCGAVVGLQFEIASPVESP